MPDASLSQESASEQKPSQDSLMQDAEKTPPADEYSAKALEDMFDGEDLDEDAPESSALPSASEPSTQEPM